MDREGFLRKGNIIAVVGATVNQDKWGFKIFKTLKGKFPKIYPVNPKYREVLGCTCYPSLKDIPEKPDTVIAVVPPDVTEKVVIACKEIGIGKVWMQPGSESKKAIEYCKKNGIDCIFNACFVADGLKEEFLV
jgi:predicted CoA-binding protein